MTDEQKAALQSLCERYKTPFNEGDFNPAFDLPTGWVAGWAGPIYVGCSPEGEIHS